MHDWYVWDPVRKDIKTRSSSIHIHYHRSTLGSHCLILKNRDTIWMKRNCHKVNIRRTLVVCLIKEKIDIENATCPLLQKLGKFFELIALDITLPCTVLESFEIHSPMKHTITN